jgi:hypothetical protein
MYLNLKGMIKMPRGKQIIPEGKKIIRVEVEESNLALLKAICTIAGKDEGELIDSMIAKFLEEHKNLLNFDAIEKLKAKLK